MNEPVALEAADGLEARSELLEGLIGYALRRTTIVVMADFIDAMEGLGMRPVLFSMLAVIRENPGINQTTLGRALGIQRANLVPLVNELISRRLVDRRRHPKDGRAFALFMNGEGGLLLDEAIARVSRHEERVLAGLGDAERRQLLTLLNKVRSG
ncbi:MarR family winged helix-turn-helix transcriptional regulator [Sphingosinicella terrae]|uniref:MarR family winged helix-turn-helix transcriptional regulator n=1 Tax=Sphingosinicella terrae TaxID=2172047 RepID=UPI000E0D00F4|nr:MarR family transcriptional regulator [Sphingosinicella terrae]